jgi:replication factor A1
MTATEISKAVDDITNAFKDKGINVDKERIESLLNQYVNDFKIPIGSALAPVRKKIASELSVDVPGKSRDTITAKVDEIKDYPQGTWMNIPQAKITKTFGQTKSIKERGLIANEYDKVFFLVNDKATDVPETLEEGKVYQFDNVVTNVFNGDIQIHVNKNSSVKELPDVDIETDKPISITGIVQNVQKGTGYVKRCGECNKVLQKGECPNHGKVDKDNTKEDVRTLFVFDDGKKTYNVYMNAELTEKATGVSVEKALDIIMDSLQPEDVTDLITEKMNLRYGTITVRNGGRYYITDEVDLR